MSADQIAHANWRLANPPVMDVAVSRRMGLFVVARLAARHGIRVRLRLVPSGGLIGRLAARRGGNTRGRRRLAGQRQSDMNAIDAAADAPAAAGSPPRDRRGRRGRRLQHGRMGERRAFRRRGRQFPLPGRRNSRRCAPTPMTTAASTRRACRSAGPSAWHSYWGRSSAPFRTSPQARPRMRARGAGEFSGGPPAAVEDGPCGRRRPGTLVRGWRSVFGNDTDALRASPDPFGNGTDTFGAGAGAFEGQAASVPVTAQTPPGMARTC